MLALPLDEVHVFVVRVPLVGGREDALSVGERRRADAFRRVEDRQRFVASRQALREILGAYVGVAPGDVAFESRCARCGDASHGKPRLARPAGSGVSFSASRSGDVVLVALARGREVGVDVERVREDVDHAEVAARFFAPDERGVRDAAGFYDLWTRKEAWLKLTGEGLAGDLAAGAPPGVWTVRLDAPEGYAAALAADGSPCRVVTRPWP